MAGNLMRFDPINEMMRLDPFRNIDDLFREFSVTPSLRGLEPEPRIRLDVEEADDAYLVKADLPGMKKEDIKIAVEGNRVSISAECKREKEEKSNGNVVRSERYYGHQQRSFTLPQDVDDAKASASYSDGVLSLSLPKKAGTERRQIAVK
ncbi:Hsp20/alpha crystallin family protein [Noviherbaspirillum denitrificans]|uniref:Stress protein n=1 Tax=Noviherbaspirillum denitrificans TaxID=1968433 RepID=A0A254TFG0_9BURK|nr:Hsp20/alpha crystallin family protein [Noviherbaspirillum denitrificans]OWW21360.1 stress protein [Noviherbaspirillum denitrificans]